jgi:2'-5' RNA ligase
VNVLWAGIKDGRDDIVELMRTLGEKLSHVRKERYDPSPHLTLGRVKSGRNRKTLLDMVEKFGSLGMGDMLVENIKLKRSELRAEGPVYTDVKIFPLK